MQGLNPDSFFSRLFIDGISQGALGAAAIYAGSFVAPSNKTIVALVLSGLILVSGGFLMFPAVLLSDWWAVYGSLAFVVAAGTTAW